MPAQCKVVPPTPLHVQVGASAKFSAISEAPVHSRLSRQVNLPSMAYSSFSKSVAWKRGPASKTTTSIPFCASSLASVPPPAPEPTITTTESSSPSKVTAARSSKSSDIGYPYFTAPSASPRIMWRCNRNTTITIGTSCITTAPEIVPHSTE